MIRDFNPLTEFLKREPELSRLLTTEKLNAVKEIAFSDFCNDLRNDYGSIPTNVMLPYYFAQSRAISASDVISASFSDSKKRLNRFVIEKTVTTCTGTNKVILKGSKDNITFYKIGEITLDASAMQTFKFPSAFDYYNVEIEVSGVLSMVADLYLVESPFDHCLNSLFLSYAYGQCIKTDDIFITLSDKHRKEYERRFENLNFWYDSDGNGVNDREVASMNTLQIIERSC